MRADDPRVEMETDPHGKSGVAVLVEPRAVEQGGEADVISSKTAVANLSSHPLQHPQRTVTNCHKLSK
jgi:hypothetical protein